jgi:hypothetical protein
VREEKKVKKQHYVPRHYLKNFSINERIFSYDIIQNKVISTNINDIATRRFFYDDQKLDLITGEQTYEKALSALESIFDKYLQEFIRNLNNGHTGLSDRVFKSTLSELIALQQIRTPTQEKKNGLLFDKLKNEIQNWDGKNSVHNINFPEISFHDHFGTSLENLQERAPLYFEKIWIVWQNGTNLKFITSDNPVVGFEDPVKQGYEIYFPISPEYSISLYDKIKYSDYMELDGQMVSIQESNVLYYNDLIFKNAERNFFSINDDFKYLLNK